MRPIYVDAITGKPIQTINPVMEAELQKGHLDAAFRSSDLKATKTGKEIREAVNRLMVKYQEKLSDLTAQFGAVAKKMGDCGLGTPEFPKFEDGGYAPVNRFTPAVKWGDMSSEQCRCADEFDNLVYKIRDAKADIASANNIIAMVKDDKSYPVDITTHAVLFA